MAIIYVLQCQFVLYTNLTTELRLFSQGNLRPLIYASQMFTKHSSAHYDPLHGELVVVSLNSNSNEILLTTECISDWLQAQLKTSKHQCYSVRC